MAALFETPYRRVAPLVGAAALLGWVLAYVEAAPRLAAGPLCSTRDDLFVLAGHCPACGVSTLLTMLFLAGVALDRRHAVIVRRARL
jgi:hypothetical protein